MLGAMALSVGCSRFGGTSSRRPAYDQLACPHKVLPQMASLAGKHGGAIEIELGGARIRVESEVELATLSTVLSAIRGVR